ncbi:L-lactate dehydrogenase complex protein LldG [Thermosporothrix hazakensis]|jgi:L-lactate dehydrogenase complex protein LldG|uniref:L-lactate dehydrogenase complex protein LldG n=2 Tax=Thermosporothrix TaxID=768650 RepID=A0A326USH2_THEHA|nr:LUD domain-containing protein [Thermosporothrix hazakensis]PZW34367.1 L-lactate dehydrogenase complex protein LldG [Thermosporothrix hazakensis]BBH85489.1 lactate utilization protein C [Thermosporothrix sp. COM3]GCE46084.1 lactate utilization protein C [Thermosporothrix hazakensis]
MTLQNAKYKMLTRIWWANATIEEPPEVERSYRQRDERDRETILNEFVACLRDYKAHVIRTSEDNLSQEVTAVCQRFHVKRLVIPADLPRSWLPDGVEVRRDVPPLSTRELNEFSNVMTGCALAIAQTGTIVLNAGETQGRRALSLIPDLHCCVVFERQVVGLVPEAIAKLAEHAMRPITFISGPSATSDIEFCRVEGVHGPRTLIVCVVSQHDKRQHG